MQKATVAIVGRPNIGKSTLFNRIFGARAAIVDDVTGVTRDRLYRLCEWCGSSFDLIDTGGIGEKNDNEIFPALLYEQASIAISEADVIIFLVDGLTGPLDADEVIASILRKTSKPIILVANKIDNTAAGNNLYEFFKLGYGEPFSVSAEHGLGIGDLLDLVVSKLPVSTEIEDEEDIIKIAIIGRPNVGKSSIVNRLLNEDRVIVSDIPGTTRDAIDSLVSYNGEKFILVDTAGIRRKAKVDEALEKYCVIKAVKAMQRCDCAIIVIDANEGITAQDKRIAGIALEAGKACVVIANKWDMIEKDGKTYDQFVKKLKTELEFLSFAPIECISAKTGLRAERIIQLAEMSVQESARRIPTSELNDLIQEMVLASSPPTDKGRQLKILFASQVSVKPPLFVLHINSKELMHFSYLRHIENVIRQTYGFVGTPLRFKLKERIRKIK